jgi:quinolinate synthase
MTVYEMQQEILRLKKENDVCILAHAYQGQEILDVADYVGDSYGLSVQASKAPNKTVLMCGVRFMAETCKVLSPEKKVILSHPEAGCPMADQMDKEDIEALLPRYPGYAVVCYINTTSRLKTICDVCVTSSSAVKIIRAMDQKDILFIPDQNLAQYIQDQVPEKNIKFLRGGCPRHALVNSRHVREARAKHPDALLLVHPECQPEVVKAADYVGSTTGIMNFAKNSDAKEFIIGTETSILEHLQFACPDKKFHYLTRDLMCPNMKMTTLADVLGCVKGTAGEVIELEPEVIAGAKRCIDEMIRLGG